MNQECTLLDRVRPAVAVPCEHELFLSKFGERDRKTFAKHLALNETKLGPAATEQWYRFARVLMSLAPHPAKIVAQQAIQFYIPDGKYRMQVFGLQILEDGALAVYAGNVLAEGTRAGILGEATEADMITSYRIVGSGESLAIVALDVQTRNPAPICKGMTGWHRKAICITLPVQASAVQVEAALSLCVLAAEQWAAAA